MRSRSRGRRSRPRHGELLAARRRLVTLLVVAGVAAGIGCGDDAVAPAATTGEGPGGGGAAGAAGHGGAEPECSLGLDEPEYIVDLEATSQATVALTSRGRVFCWGYDAYYGCMNVAAWPHVPEPRWLRDLKCIASIHTGAARFAITEDRRLLGWGHEYDGEMGDGRGTSRPSWVPAEVLLPGPVRSARVRITTAWAELEDGSRWAWGSLFPEGWAYEPAAYEGPTAVFAEDLVCGLDAQGVASCMGDNAHGTVGDGTQLPRAELTPVATDGRFAALFGEFYAVFGVTLDGRILAWGENYDGLLGIDAPENTGIHPPTALPTLSSVVAIEPASSHACAVEADGDVHCWGRNVADLLDDSGLPMLWAPVGVPDLAPALDLAGGSEHTCSLKTDRTVWCRGAAPYRGRPLDENGDQQPLPSHGAANRVVFPFEGEP